MLLTYEVNRKFQVKILEKIVTPTGLVYIFIS